MSVSGKTNQRPRIIFCAEISPDARDTGTLKAAKKTQLPNLNHDKLGELQF